MENIGNSCIISCGIGKWYPTGVERLERSLIYHGYAGKIMTWKNELPPGAFSHEANPYGFKVAAFEAAIKAGHSKILWLDASFWAVRNPHHLFDIINDNGIFAFRTGYNCAQTVPDNLLMKFETNRDYAEKMPEYATGAVGLNLDNPDADKIFKKWSELCNEGYFNNSRSYNPAESADKRFLHSRQDQSAFSMAVNAAGVNMNYTDYVAYYGSGFDKKKIVFFINSL